MLLSGWLARLTSQIVSPANKRPRRKGIAQQRQTSQISRGAESLETKVLLSNVAIGNINEGQNIVISFPGNTYINSVQFLTATTPSADMLDFNGYTISTTSSATTITIPTIPTIQDNVDEYDENFVIRVMGTSGSGSGSGSGGGYQPISNDYTGQIIDDDAAPVLRLQRLDGSGNLMTNNVIPETGYIAQTGTLEPARFRVIADHPTAKAAVLTWSTANGTAIGTTLSSFDVNQHNQDFRLLFNQTVNLTPWSYGSPNSVDITVGELTVPVNNDRWYENPETFLINLGATNATLQSNSVTVTIDDPEDLPVAFVPSSLTVQEDAGALTIPVTLSNPSLLPVVVAYATSDGLSMYPAKSVEDYLLTSGVVTFQPGETVANVSVASARPEMGFGF